MKKPALIDVPVLLIFFVRPETFGKVFEQVKKARPSRLYLFQDGARENRPDDFEKIEACRKIAEDIDWECTVYRNYSHVNLGCDPAEYEGIKWAFTNEEYLIILEDDDVPSQSFFFFCKELLEKYKNDERIYMISGMNHLGIYDKTPYSYFFAKTGCIWGWATWKRCFDYWERELDFVNDADAVRLLTNAEGHISFAKELIKMSKERREITLKKGKVESYETINGMARRLYNGINIIPNKNLISNIGIAQESTHSVNNINKMPKGIRRVFNMKTYDLEFPLRHPQYIIDDVEYVQNVAKIMGANKVINMYRRIEGIVRRFLVK